MKKEILFVLLNNFADWEGAFLATALNCGLTHAGGGTAYVSKTLSVTGQPACSLGGLTVTTDYCLATIPDEYAALILVGGTEWQSEEALRLLPIVEKSLARGILVGAICNATLFLGAHGLLNKVHHTSNMLSLLKQWGGDHYTGEHLYQERQAVRDSNIVTANGSGHLEFTRECLLWLQAGTPQEIEAYYQFNKQGFYKV